MALSSEKGKQIKSLILDIKHQIEDLPLEEIKKINPQRFVMAVDETLLNSFDTSITGNLMLDPNDHQHLEKQVQLGKGSFGAVFRCVAKQDIHFVNKQVSISKGSVVICKDVANLIDERKKHQIKSEIVAHYTINESGCRSPKLFGYFHNKTEDQIDNIYVIMEFVYGITLENKLTGYLIFPNDKILANLERWIKDVEKTLKCFHEHDIVHRDVKVDNIIINNLSGDDNSSAVLIDYGLSCKVIERCSPYMFSSYTSPLKFQAKKNQMEKTLDMEERNDMFALGMTIIDCLYLLCKKKRYSRVLNLNENSFDDINTHIANVYNILLKWNSGTKNLLLYAIKLLNEGLLKSITPQDLILAQKLYVSTQKEEINSEYYEDSGPVKKMSISQPIFNTPKLSISQSIQTPLNKTLEIQPHLSTTQAKLLNVSSTIAPSDYSADKYISDQYSTITMK